MEKYTGIRPESEAKNTPDPEYSHTERRGNTDTKYYHTWRNESENEVRPAFRDDEEPNKRKIKAYDMFFRFFLACLALWFIVKYF